MEKSNTKLGEWKWPVFLAEICYNFSKKVGEKQNPIGLYVLVNYFK